MYTDPIIDQIRKYREAYAERFKYDVKAMVEDLRKRQKDSGRPTVSREPIRTSTNASPAKATASGKST